MKIQEAGENYLESIYILSKRQHEVRATDICSYLGYSRPTVSTVLKKFREDGYVTVDENNHIALTELGLSIAEKMYERHKRLTEFFVVLGVDEATAAEDACKIEHDISPQTFDALVQQLEKIKQAGV